MKKRNNKNLSNRNRKCKMEEQNKNIEVEKEDVLSEQEVENTEKVEEVDALTLKEKELEELKDKYLRTVAEFENYKKRTLKEKAELILNGAEKTVGAFLPVVDDMERAIDNVENSENIEALKEGFEMIFKKLLNTLKGLGVNKIETENADFNVDFHEAIAMIPGVDENKKGKIIDCVQTGYTINDKVIRHAKVAVGQ